MTRKRAVQAITSADRALSEDINERFVRYSVSMGLRLVCLVAAFYTSGWLRWVCVAGAVVLPTFAVLIANAGKARAVEPTAEMFDGRAIGGGEQPPGHPADAGAPAATDRDATDPASSEQRADASARPHRRAPRSALPPIDLRGGYLR